MAGFLYKGIVLQQHKEPALSRELREFLNADTIGLKLEREPVEHPEDLTHEEIIEIARAAKIVDERDGQPLADKLERARHNKCHLVVVDVIDDEPYISSQLNPMLKNQQLSSDGLAFCRRASGAENAYFAVYKNLTDLESRIPKQIGPFPVIRLRGCYPAEYQASAELREEEGVLMLGAGALIHLARAVFFNKPQTTSFITVAGNCVGNPTNLEVSIGMTVTQTLERCGLIDDPNRVVVGGSMTGISVIDTDATLVTPTTRAILAFRLDTRSMRLHCIGCSRCTRVCPEGLNPFLIYRSIQERRYGLFRELDAQRCIRCGTCSYMCPAKLDLSAAISKAAQVFRPSIVTIEATEKRVADNRVCHYDNYFADFQLGKAIETHRKARHALLRDFSARTRQASAANSATNREIDRRQQTAQNHLRAALSAAEGTLAQARKAMLDRQGNANQLLTSAMRSQKAVYRSADKALEDAERAKTAAARSADKTMKQTLVIQAQMAEETVHTAEKALAAMEKSGEATAEQLQGAKKNLEQLRLTAAAEIQQGELRADKNCTGAKKDALAAYEQAGVICEQTKKRADDAVVRAEEFRQQEFAASEEIFVTDQATCAAAKQKAQDAFALSEADCANARAEAEKLLEATNQRIREESLREQGRIDAILCEARAQALKAAERAAHACAGVENRQTAVKDYLPPTRLTASARALLSPGLRLPFDREGYPAVGTLAFRKLVSEQLRGLAQPFGLSDDSRVPTMAAAGDQSEKEEAHRP